MGSSPFARLACFSLSWLISFSMLSRIANLQARWQISVRSAPEKPTVVFARYVRSTFFEIKRDQGFLYTDVKMKTHDFCARYMTNLVTGLGDFRNNFAPILYFLAATNCSLTFAHRMMHYRCSEVFWGKMHLLQFEFWSIMHLIRNLLELLVSCEDLPWRSAGGLPHPAKEYRWVGQVVQGVKLRNR